MAIITLGQLAKVLCSDVRLIENNCESEAIVHQDDDGPHEGADCEDIAEQLCSDIPLSCENMEEVNIICDLKEIGHVKFETIRNRYKFLIDRKHFRVLRIAFKRVLVEGKNYKAYRHITFDLDIFVVLTMWHVLLRVCHF